MSAAMLTIDRHLLLNYLTTQPHTIEVQATTPDNVSALPILFGRPALRHATSLLQGFSLVLNHQGYLDDWSQKVELVDSCMHSRKVGLPPPWCAFY